MKIEEIRKKYPQYNDLSDRELAERLHKKSYSDMPFDEFSKRIGLYTYSQKEGGFVPATKEADALFSKAELWENLKKESPEMAGATLGALALSPLAPPLGPTAGAIAGGVVGATAKRYGITQEMQGTQNLLLHKLYQYKYEPPTGPRATWEGIKDIGKAGTKQGAYELVGGAFAAGASKMLAPFAKRITEEGRLAMQTLDEYMPKAKWYQPISRLFGKKQPAILPSEMTESRALDILHNLGEASLIGGERIADFKIITRGRAVENMIDDLASNFTKTADADAIGETVTLLIEQKWKSYRKAITDPLYNTIDEMLRPTIEKRTITEMIPSSILGPTGKQLEKSVSKQIEEEISPVIISTKNLKEFIKPLKRRIAKLQGIDATYAGDEIVNAIDRIPEGLDFLTAKDLRTRLIDIADDFKISNPKAPAIGLAKKLEAMLDHSISKNLAEANPEALTIWRQANDLYKQGAAKYNNYFLRKLMNAANPKKLNEPEKVVNLVFRNKGISGINKLKAVLGKRQWEMMETWYFGDLLAKSVDQRTGELIGRKLLNNMYGRSGMGQKSINAIFKKEHIKQIENIAHTLKVIQEQQGEGAGKIFIQLKQAAAASQVAGAVGFGAVGMPKTAGAIIIGPYVLSRLMLNPIGARWLAGGIRVSPLAKTVPATTLRVLNAADLIKDELQAWGE